MELEKIFSELVTFDIEFNALHSIELRRVKVHARIKWNAQKTKYFN
jgi:hypothetical protein